MGPANPLEMIATNGMEHHHTHHHHHTATTTAAPASSSRHPPTIKELTPKKASPQTSRPRRSSPDQWHSPIPTDTSGSFHESVVISKAHTDGRTHDQAHGAHRINPSEPLPGSLNGVPGTPCATL